MKTNLCMTLLCGTFAASAFGNTIYVSPTGGGDGSSSESPLTYKAGIAAARSGDTVQFADGEYKANVNAETGNQDPFNLYPSSGAGYSGVTVVGNVEHPERVVLDAHGAGVRFLGIKSEVTVRGITFQNQKAGSDSYSAVWGSGGTLNIDHCIFSGITNSGNGAAICLKSSGGAVVENCQFVDCVTTGGSGGAVGSDNDAVKATFRRCTFTRCRAVNGGALHRLTQCAEDCIFEDCSDAGTVTGGGAIHQNVAGAAFTNCVFRNCSSPNRPGGAAYFNNAVELADCVFTNCTTSGKDPKGSAVYANSTLTMKGGVVDACGVDSPSGTAYGSAVYAHNNATIENVEFKNCVSVGGILCLETSGNIAGCKFHDCRASSVANMDSGCAIRLRAGTVSVRECSFLSLVSARGAGINTAANLTKLDVRNCLFAGCVSTTGNGGAAMEVGATTFNVDNCTFANCRITGSSNDYACPLEINGGTLTARNCIFWDNWRTVGTPQLRSVYVRNGSGTLSSSVYDGMRSSGIPTLVDTMVITECPFVRDGSWNGDVFTPGDYTLAATMGGEANPCLGAGVKLDWMTAESKDLAGNPRLRENDLVDLGCYEYCEAVAKSGIFFFVF